MSHFGELLRDARTRAGLTQKELAEKVPINHSYISKMENEGFLPSRDVALKLAVALGMSEEAKQDFLLEAKAAGKEDLKGFALVKVTDGQKLRRRRGGALASPPIEEPSPVSDSVESTTVGQDIDEALEGLSQEEYNRLREILVPLARQLVRLRKLPRGE